MKRLSEEMIKAARIKPDSDTCQHWYANSVTQWFLEQLQITHQQALEELKDIDYGNSEMDLQRFHTLKSASIQVEEIANIVDSMKRKEGDDE